MSEQDPYAGRTVADHAMGHAMLEAREKRVPKVGEGAPAFELPLADGSGTVSLASYQARSRAVVLVFGSHT